jgi:hypothetical protein
MDAAAHIRKVATMRDDADDWVELEGRVETQTKKAKLIEFTNGPKAWVPKSQIINELESGREPDVYIFHIKAWFARKESLV